MVSIYNYNFTSENRSLKILISLICIGNTYGPGIVTPHLHAINILNALISAERQGRELTAQDALGEKPDGTGFTASP